MTTSQRPCLRPPTLFNTPYLNRLWGSSQWLGDCIFSLWGSILILLGSRKQFLIGPLGSNLVLLGSSPDTNNELIAIGAVYSYRTSIAFYQSLIYTVLVHIQIAKELMFIYPWPISILYHNLDDSSKQQTKNKSYQV